MKPLTGHLQRAVIDELRRRAPRRGMAIGVAMEAGVHVSHVQNVLAGRARPGLALALGLGLVRIVEVAPAAELAPKRAEPGE